jgi:hypothetical protein
MDQDTAVEHFRTGYRSYLTGQPALGVFQHLGRWEAGRRRRRGPDDHEFPRLDHVEELTYLDFRRALSARYVTSINGHWKGPREALVPKSLHLFVRDAMDAEGSIVEHEEARGSFIYMYSAGYWANGY